MKFSAIEILTFFILSIVVLICVLALVGQEVGSPLLFRWHGQVGMAIPTAVSFILLCFTILLLIFDRK
jgi:hypothetical protein